LVLNTNYIQFQPDDHVAHASNPAFDASTLEVWGPLLNGATVEVLDREDALNPAALGKAIRERQLTVMWVTAALFNQLSFEPGLFAPLRCVLFGGEAADVQAVRRVLKSGPPRHLINGYGPTEN